MWEKAVHNNGTTQHLIIVVDSKKTCSLNALWKTDPEKYKHLHILRIELSELLRMSRWKTYKEFKVCMIFSFITIHGTFAVEENILFDKIGKVCVCTPAVDEGLALCFAFCLVEKIVNFALFKLTNIWHMNNFQYELKN